VSDIGEPDWVFLPQHAGTDFAILNLGGECDAGERLVLSQCARAELAGELPQTE
jgi:hypothetical protein